MDEYPQATRILQHLQEGDEKVDAALILYTRLASYDTLERLSLRDERRFRKRLGVKMAFRSDNPTGHYELELALVCSPPMILAINVLCKSKSQWLPPCPTCLALHILRNLTQNMHSVQ